MTRPLRSLASFVGIVTVAVLAAVTPRAQAARPVSHVVLLFLENHSFDNVLGKLCVRDGNRCDGVITGRLSDGSTIPLRISPDIVPSVDHSHGAQVRAINGGKMDRFETIEGCHPSGYACFTQYAPRQIPNIARLARAFALSDRTFEDNTLASMVSHMDLVSATTNGFVGNNPNSEADNRGWGCGTLLEADYWLDGAIVQEPTCIPFMDGGTLPDGRHTDVPPVPTIMDQATAAGVSWKLYAGKPSSIKDSGAVYNPCYYYVACYYSEAQRAGLVPASRFLTDAAATLPALSIITPTGSNSTHNKRSMLQGDNWVGQVVAALQNGPNWPSTAMFITWDDCGCFYDHVAPPGMLGIRLPMLIVSPYARAGFVDHRRASVASMLAYAEHQLDIPTLGQADATAYDFSDAFDYTQAPLPPVRLTSRPLPRWEIAWLRHHPIDDDVT